MSKPKVVIPAPTPGERADLGAFASREEAEAFAEKLRASGRFAGLRVEPRSSSAEMTDDERIELMLERATAVRQRAEWTEADATGRALIREIAIDGATSAPPFDSRTLAACWTLVAALDDLERRSAT